MQNMKTEPDSISILLADDHAIVREGLRTLINTEPGMEVVGEAEDGVEAVLKAHAFKPNVLLLDMVMPRKDGLQTIIEIKSSLPDTQILVLTSFSEDDKVFPAIKAGALGYLLKNTSPQKLIDSIREVHRGEPSMSPDIAIKLMRELQSETDLPPTEAPLTERELEVLKLLAKGMSNQEIAEKLFIGEGTVRTHVSSILDKLHLANRTQAALYALREGLAPLDSPNDK
jgi:NarL family two-component system response regulator LiaR